jgi:hypothetical protein
VTATNTPLTTCYEDQLAGVLSCYDWIVITGTLPGACYAAGMTSFLNAHDMRIFAYPRLAEPLRERIRSRAQELASAAGVTIEEALVCWVTPSGLTQPTMGLGSCQRRLSASVIARLPSLFCLVRSFIANLQWISSVTAVAPEFQFDQPVSW